MRKRRRTLKKICSEVFSGSFFRPQQALIKVENMDPNIERFSLIKRNFHGALSAYSQIYDEKRNKASKPSWTYL